MAIIYKIATVKIAETLAIRGFAPPPYAISSVHGTFLLFTFSLNITHLEKFCKRVKVLNFKIAKFMKEGKFCTVRNFIKIFASENF